MNRVKSAQDNVTGTQNPAPGGLTENFSYDAFGNLKQSGNFSFTQAYTSSNRVSGWNYDAAGNLLLDSFSNSLTWNANEMISASSGTTYAYDGQGDRIAKSGSSATDYLYFNGRQIARYVAGQWTDLIYGPTGLLAEVPGTQTGAPVYRMTDQIGSSVGTLSSTGTLLGGIQDYAPFGQLFNGSSNYRSVQIHGQRT